MTAPAEVRPRRQNAHSRYQHTEDHAGRGDHGPSQRQHLRHAQHVPALDTDSGRARYEELLATNRRNRNIVRTMTLFMAAVVAVGTIVLSARPQSGQTSLLGGFIALVLISASLGAASKFLNQKSYYTVPGSRDVHGDHRCLRCGGKGIYRSTQYQTTTTRAVCSKCKLPFWTE